MNKLAVAKGVGKYFIKKSIPSKYRKQHVNVLLEDENIRLANKFQILIDTKVMKEYEKYWESIFNPEIKQQHFREKYGINIERHIKHFDPTGKTLGCGCALCGMLYRIKTKEKSLNTINSVLRFIDVVMKIKTASEYGYSKSDIKNLDFRTFYKDIKCHSVLNGNHDPEILKFDGQSFINKDEEQLIKNKEDLLEKQITLESKLRTEKNTLNTFSKLTGIPIKIENIEKIWKKINFYKNKKNLINNKSIDSLSLDECLNLTNALGLYNIDKKRLKNIRKELNYKSEKYVISKHMSMQTHDVFIPLLNKRVSVPKSFRINKIINEISHDVVKEKAKQSLDNIDALTRLLLKNYRRKLLREELDKHI